MGLLQKRLAGLLVFTALRKDSDSAATVGEVLVEVSRRLNRPAWVAYLVGGTLRDLLIGPESDAGFQPRDIDIIVEGASREELQEVLSGTLVFERFTRFAGLHLSRSLSSRTRLQFDIWTLADTWGFQSQKIAPRIEDFPKTTFLNIDSCAAELMPPAGRERKFFESGFFESIAKRVLDVNYAPNPYPYVCVVRSLVLAVQLDFSIARPLAKFILEHTAACGIGPLIEAQQSHYGMVRSDAEELESWLGEIGRQFRSGKHDIHIETPRTRRLELWRDYPHAVNRG
jgi:hypothetical protein